MPSNDKFPVIVVVFHPWCLAGLHDVPSGYLRGYQGLAQRKPGESEEDLHERALAVAMASRGPGCGILLVEDREKVKCTEHAES